MSEALTDALLRRAQSGWKDVWDAGKYAFGPEGYRGLKKNIRYYGGPHLGSTVNDVLDVLPELLGPGADVRDMVEGSDALTKALMKRDGIGALEGGAQLFGGLLGLGIPGSVAMFAGPGAKNANMGALQRAEDLAAQGADARKIWDETGWFQGADGKWRFEIDDSGARFDGSVPGDESRRVGDRPLVGAIGDVAVHPELMRAYPDVADVEFARVPMQKSQYGGYAGSSSRGKPLVAVAEGRGIPNERSAALHELQHDIQRREGFSGGGSASEFEAVAKAAEDALLHLSDLHSRSGFIDAFTEARRAGKLKTPRDAKEFRDSYYASSSEELWDEYAKLVRPLQDAEYLGVNLKHWDKAGNAYKRLAGEVEARNVQTRRDFTPDQRRAQPPWETEDVPRDRQIVRFR